MTIIIKNKKMYVVTLSLALLFQPLIKIPLGRSIWVGIDIVVAAFLIYLFLRKNVFKVQKCNMKTIIILILSLIQLPCVVEGWISYFLNCIIKMLSSIIFLFAIVSFVWWPLDMLCGILWAGCECIKQRCLSRNIEFSDALMLYTRLFPTV